MSQEIENVPQTAGIVDKTTPHRKKPKDRKAKANAEYVETTLRGKTWRVKTACLDDAELLESLLEADEDGNPKAVFAALNKLLGPAGKKRAIEAVRDPKTGIAPFSALTEFFVDLMKSLDPKS